MKTTTDILRKTFSRFAVPHDSVTECANKLRIKGIRVCSFENLSEKQGLPLILNNVSLEQILNEIVDRNTGYRWDKPSADLVNIFPTNSVLDSQLSPISVRKKAWLMLTEDFHINQLGIFLFQEFGESDGPIIDVHLEHTNLRTVFNTIVEQLKPLVWHIAGKPGKYYLSFTSVPTDVNFTYRTFRNGLNFIASSS